MSEINDFISQIPIGEVAAQLGVDEQTASAAVAAAAPALVQGMDANAQDPGGAASLLSAFDSHAQAPTVNSIAQVDQGDGAKIVQNVFGSNEKAVANRLSGAQPALGGDMMQKLLPILAPLVLQWLAKKWSNRGAGSGNTQASPGGGLGDIFGDVLGRAGGQSAGSSSSGGLGGILGDLLGGGKK